MRSMQVIIHTQDCMKIIQCISFAFTTALSTAASYIWLNTFLFNSMGFCCETDCWILALYIKRWTNNCMYKSILLSFIQIYNYATCPITVRFGVKLSVATYFLSEIISYGVHKMSHHIHTTCLWHRMPMSFATNKTSLYLEGAESTLGDVLTLRFWLQHNHHLQMYIV